MQRACTKRYLFQSRNFATLLRLSCLFLRQKHENPNHNTCGDTILDIFVQCMQIGCLNSLFGKETVTNNVRNEQKERQTLLCLLKPKLQ